MVDLVENIAAQVRLPANVVWTLAAVLLVLALGSVVRVIGLLRPGVSAERRRSRLGSLGTWWVLFAFLVLAAVLGPAAMVMVFAVISFLGLREFRAIARQRMVAMRVWWRLTYVVVPVHYALVHFGQLGPVWTLIPVWVFVILLVRLVVTGQTAGFLETAGVTFLGLMLIVYLFSHAALLLVLPDRVNPAAGAVGLLLFLLLLTAANDIAQALWGRWLGRHPITPAVSPNKTWEGFLLGLATTVILGVLLAGLLTPFVERPLHLGTLELEIGYVPALVIAALIAVGGFFGDITMSAMKREAGVKDSGALLPGQGGVLDRIDSLTFTAPLFFYFVFIFYY